MKLQLLFLGLLVSHTLRSQAIIINEFSQGCPFIECFELGIKEWVELIVVEDNQDIGGVYFADDDPNFNSIDFQLANINEFDNVPKNAKIIIYNSTLKDETLPPDDTDFSDYSIVIPSDNTTFLSATGWTALNNDGDDFGIFTSDGTGIFGISYGSGTPTTDFNSNYGMVNLGSVGAGTAAGFTGDDIANISDNAYWNSYDDEIATPAEFNTSQLPLPIQLTDFYAENENGIIKLNWITASEINNDHFIISQSEDGKQFAPIAKIKGAGNSSNEIYYQYQIFLTSYKTLYFQLTQVDFDGQFETFRSIRVENTTNDETLVFPIPASDYIYLSSKINDGWSLYDSQGKIIKENLSLEKIDIQFLSKGSYYLKNSEIKKNIHFIKE